MLTTVAIACWQQSRSFDLRYGRSKGSATVSMTASTGMDITVAIGQTMLIQQNREIGA
jgi:hypothetical protein